MPNKPYRSMDELIDKFSIERVHKAGAKFDFEKAKWFNHEWIKLLSVQSLKFKVKAVFEGAGIVIANESFLEKVIELIKDRCSLLTDFYEQGKYFFVSRKLMVKSVPNIVATPVIIKPMSLY